MAKKRRKSKLNPNRFQKQDDLGMFSFDPIRRDVFRWGLIAGASGGVIMLWQQNSIVWLILGVMVVALITNLKIGQAARRIPRLHAIIMSSLGVFIGIFAVIILGSIILNIVQSGGASQ